MEAEIISCEEFAKRVGTSSRTIRRKIESGKLYGDALSKVQGRKIPFLVFHIAVKQYEATADKTNQQAKLLQNRVKRNTKTPAETLEPGAGKTETPKKAPEKKKAKAKAEPKKADPKKIKVEVLPSSEKIEDENTQIYDRLAKAKMESEEYKATLQKLKIEKEQGKLIDSDVAKETIVKLVMETRKSLLNLPDNIGPELLACKDLLDLQNKLTEGINLSLLNLSRFNSLEETNE